MKHSPIHPVAGVQPRVILGVDPGSRVAGYAFIKCRQQRMLLPSDFVVIEAGVLRADPRLAHDVRIGLLHRALHDLIERHTPEVCVLEKAFYDKNVSSAIKLGEVRGAFIAACARSQVKTEEITPAEVKKTITGNGRAEKDQVALALKALTGFDRGTLPHDVTDALAIALCYGMGVARRFAAKPFASAQPFAGL